MVHKKRLFAPGCIANPRDTTRYRCGLRLARTTHPSFHRCGRGAAARSLVPAGRSAERGTPDRAGAPLAGCRCLVLWPRAFWAVAEKHPRGDGASRSPLSPSVVRCGDLPQRACGGRAARSARRFQPPRKMRLHGACGGLGIACHHGRQNGAVLIQRILDAPLLEQRVVAVELHHLAQVGHHLAAPAVQRRLPARHAGPATP